MGWLRLDLVRLLVLGLPALALNWWLVGAAVPFAESPGRAAVLVVPLMGAALVLSRFLRRDTRVTLGAGFLGFFLVYCLAFSALTGTDPLIGRRTLLAPQQDDLGYTTGEEQLGHARRQIPGLNRLGDWHYWFAREAPPVHDLLVLTLPSSDPSEPSDGTLGSGPGATGIRVDSRRRFAFLINKAIQERAQGIAFDYYLERSTAADPALASFLAQADKAGLPVLFGYRPQAGERGLVPTPVPERLAGALPFESLGHLAGYREADGRLRMVPLMLTGERTMPALAARIAEALHGGPLAPPPTERLFQFNRPIWGIPTVQFSTESDSPTDWSLFRNRFVVVGTEADFDLRRTPFGPIRGVQIHAIAAHSLRTGNFIRRLDARYIFPILFGACYVLTLLYARGSPNRKLVAAGITLTALILTAAAIAMQVGLLWITVSYPLVAIWLLAGLLIGARTVRRRLARPGTVPASPGVGSLTTVRAPSVRERPGAPREIEIVASKPPEEPAAGAFDVFLSHNSRDKQQVIEIGESLRLRGLAPWLDIWELAPGRDWQAELETVLRTVRSSAVFVGGDGLGPWEIPELRASLSECVRRGLPVIPVLLPGAARQPELPLFLTQFTWVDLRLGVTAEGLDRLEWGITGIKPAGMRAA